MPYSTIQLLELLDVGLDDGLRSFTGKIIEQVLQNGTELTRKAADLSSC